MKWKGIKQNADGLLQADAENGTGNGPHNGHEDQHAVSKPGGFYCLPAHDQGQGGGRNSATEGQPQAFEYKAASSAHGKLEMSKQDARRPRQRIPSQARPAYQASSGS